jgi:hypothetical protein
MNDINNCTWIEKYNNINIKKDKNWFSFCDAVFIISVKKDKLTQNQIDSIENIKKLGCENITYWCYTYGYRSDNCNILKKYNTIFKNANIINLSYNYYIIFNFCIKNNLKNILLIEDDLIIHNDIWKDYEIYNKNITSCLNKYKNKNIILNFGHFTIFYGLKYNKNIINGGGLNTHCILYNNNSMKEYINIFKNKSNKIIPVDMYYHFSNKFKKLLFIPNIHFFQKSNINGESYKNNKKSLLFKFYKLQNLFTGRIYYQYDPLFQPYWDKLIYFFEIFILSIIFIFIFKLIKF